jgi:hypothetical protein
MSDLVIHIIQITGDLYIPQDCKLIGHQFGLGYRVQGSRFRVNRFPLFPLAIYSIGLIPQELNL